jgi:hypothetical protein
MLALEDADGVIWYLPGLDRYIGFIDGLDPGEAVDLEGYASSRGSSQERYFQPTRLILDGMDYDLAVPPYGAVPGQQTTIIREIERPAPEPKEEPKPAAPVEPPAPAGPVWEHNHKSAWAPTNGPWDFQMDYSSIWQEDQAKRVQRERDSREIWY